MLAVMEALADGERVTQGELSRRTGLNLKKVNYCLHKLLEKGHVKYQRALNNPDKRPYLYILTPSGLRAKSRLTYRFREFTLKFYSQFQPNLEHCLRRMQEAGVRQLVLGGASDVTRIVSEQVDDNGISIVGLLDEELNDGAYEGIPVIRERDLAD